MNKLLRKHFAFLLLALMLATWGIPARAQQPAGQPSVTGIDCSRFADLPLATPPGSAGVTQPAPDPMPPHPDVLDCFDQGQLSLPEAVTSAEWKLQAGIDQPQTTDAASVTGTFRTLAILVKFSDKASQVSATSFNSLLFSTAAGSMTDFYDKASYGVLDIVTVNLPGTLGWLNMPGTYASYVGTNGTGYGIDDPFPNNAQKLAADAARAADPLVNFANYDNNNDGLVDTIFIVHAGRGAEYSGSPSDIWSHSWVTNTSDRPFLDSKQIYSYTTEPEYWNSPGDMTVGVFAHELGHVLGLPDLYDTDYTSRGVGSWSLMGSGSWNGINHSGNSPAFPDAWSRVQLGWITPTAINTHTFGQSLPAVATSPFVIKMKPTDGNTNEYFLVENRQKVSYDSYLPAAGMLVWHIDANRTSNSSECRNLNRWNCQTLHYKVALEQADGLLNLEYKVNDGDSGDVFPGSANRGSYMFTTAANNSSYFSSNNPWREITNISNSGTVMTADFYIGSYDHSFQKNTPLNSGSLQNNNQLLTWGSSLGATSYEYCVDTTFDSACSTSWVSAGTNLSASPGNLSGGILYFWQVRANNAHGTSYANAGNWWSFSVQSQQPANTSIYLPFLTR